MRTHDKAPRILAKDVAPALRPEGAISRAELGMRSPDLGVKLAGGAEPKKLLSGLGNPLAIGGLPQAGVEHKSVINNSIPFQILVLAIGVILAIMFFGGAALAAVGTALASSTLAKVAAGLIGLTFAAVAFGGALGLFKIVKSSKLL